MSDIEDLIQHALDQDYNKAGQVFGDLMGQKIGDALDQQKISIADQIYNGVEPDDDDYDLGDEDIEQQDDTDFEDEEWDDDIEEDEEED